MVELLSPHTAMTLLEAREGMPLEPDHVYVIPPGRFLSVRNGALHLSIPPASQTVRMLFDFLLQSLAEAIGERAVCTILSGTATDGSVGAKAIKEMGGLVIAQDPEEADYDGMPKSAIATGAVDLVLPLAKVPEALAKYAGHRYVKTGKSGAALFLDEKLNIRFFTPAAKSLFSVSASDIVRPLADLARHFTDGNLFADAEPCSPILCRLPYADPRARLARASVPAGGPNSSREGRSRHLQECKQIRHFSGVQQRKSCGE
jgi:hypothetical protein